MHDFVHLHLHSEYSLLDGACIISEIPRKAKAEGHSAVAITDHGAMYGAVEFYKACKSEGIKPIIGCEVYVSKRSRFDKNYSEDASSDHLVLLCKNETGYRNLIKLVSKGFTEGFYIKPRVDTELLREHSEGLIALSACLGGKIPRLIAQTDMNGAKEAVSEFISIFGKDNFYLEIQDHGIELQRRVNTGLYSISEQMGVELAATNDVHYLKKSDADTQAILMCIQTNSKISDGRPLGFETNEFYYKSTSEMYQLFPNYPRALSNTVKIAEQCNFDFTFGKYFLPAFTPPDNLENEIYIKLLAEKGLNEKINSAKIVLDGKTTQKDYQNRLEYELSVINKMGYADYYLIVNDFVAYAKGQGIPVGPGRGSGAGSLVAYLLGITDVDPIKHELIFERFLNPERISMPDFDIDFCYRRRDEVIKYVTEKYGSDKVSQIITFGTMAARAAIRDCGRALNLSYSEVDRVAKALSHRYATISEAELHSPLKEMAAESVEIRRLLSTAKSLEGMPRHASTHAAGVVICDKPIFEYVPLATSGDIVVTQYDMDTIADLGLLKFDFLGLRYSTVISDTENSIRETVPDFSIETIPQEDKAAFDILKTGHTHGIFQLESSGMRQMLTEFKPDSIDDIMLAIAVYRPGPMESIPKIIENRKSNHTEYKLPQLRDILKSTYGHIVYQEQVMQIFRSLASYSYAKADIVRKAISKKQPEIINRQRDDFVSGCQNNGISAKHATELFDEIVSFAGYAFNKSHAAAYAVLAYRTAYLKAHYPAHYICALMTSEFGDRNRLAEYMSEASKLKISILPPSVNNSNIIFSANSNSIRYGLSALKNVGPAFLKNLIEERARGGEFKTVFDFCRRMTGKDLNKRNFEALITSGALDELGVYRSRLFSSYEEILTLFSEQQRIHSQNQLSLFSHDDFDLSESYSFPQIPEFSLRDKLNLEKEISGMYFSGHITDEYSQNTEDIGSVGIQNIINAFSDENPTGEYREKQAVPVIGVINAITIKKTKNGENMAFVTIEDKYAEIELVVFSKIFTEYRHLFEINNVIAIYGEISVREEGKPKIDSKSCGIHATKRNLYPPTFPFFTHDSK